MNQKSILLLLGVVASTWPGGVAADGQLSTGAAMAKLMIMYSWSASRFPVPQRVVAPEKDWPIVKNTEAQRTAVLPREEQLREARQRIAEHERELHLAREAYRLETSRIAQEPRAAPGQPVSASERKVREAQEERLQTAVRRMNQHEREAYLAKLEYGQAARAVREQRRRDVAEETTDEHRQPGDPKKAVKAEMPRPLSDATLATAHPPLATLSATDGLRTIQTGQ